MHDGMKPVLLEEVPKGGKILEVSLHEGGVLVHGLYMAGGQVVKDDHLVSALLEEVADKTADVTGTAGDEYALYHETSTRPLSPPESSAKLSPRPTTGRCGATCVSLLENCGSGR